MEKYTIQKLEEDLDNGYQIYYVYMEKKYLLYKTTENCYTQKLLTIEEKNPHPLFSMITLKRVKELFPFMTNIEYRIGISE